MECRDKNAARLINSIKEINQHWLNKISSKILDRKPNLNPAKFRNAFNATFNCGVNCITKNYDRIRKKMNSFLEKKQTNGMNFGCYLNMWITGLVIWMKILFKVVNLRVHVNVLRSV